MALAEVRHQEEVVVYLHRKHCEVLVKTEVHGVARIEVRVGVDDVALRLCKPVTAGAVSLAVTSTRE